MFTTTDCWVLFSIGFGENASTLKQIISRGDMLNHAIISKNELEISINKLLQNDYISSDEDKFYTTEKAKSFYKNNKKGIEGCIAEWLRISEVFKEQTGKPGEIRNIKVTEEDYKKSLNAYYQDFNKGLKELKILPLKTRKSLLSWISKKAKETK